MIWIRASGSTERRVIGTTMSRPPQRAPDSRPSLHGDKACISEACSGNGRSASSARFDSGPRKPRNRRTSAFIAIEKHIGQWIVIRVHRPTSRAYVPLADTLLDGDERRPSSPCLGAIDLPPRGFALSDRFGTADGGALTDVAYLAADSHLSASVAPRVHWG